ASGVAVGPALVYREGQPETASRQAATPDEELARYAAACRRAEEELDALAGRADAQARDILTAHQLMLQDPELHNFVEAAIQEVQPAEAAVRTAVEQFAGMLEALDDEYLRERAADVRDVGRRLVAALTGRTVGIVLGEPAVVVE